MSKIEMNVQVPDGYADYAWIIDTYHLAEDEDDYDCAGTMGPRDAPDSLVEALNAGKGHTFTMYDDDGNLYHTGRALVAGEVEEFHLLAPLADFGSPNDGAVLIKWAGHPEWSCEY